MGQEGGMEGRADRGRRKCTRRKEFPREEKDNSN